MHFDAVRHTLDELGLPEPPHLDAFLAWLEESGAVPLDPRRRADDHPLVLPVGALESHSVGLLFWPAALDRPSVVRQGGFGMHLELIARSIDAHLRMESAREDAAGRSPGRWSELAGDLYTSGSVARSGLPLDLWLLRHGPAPHTLLEPLIDKHLARGDTDAARITSDRACRTDVGWARPHARRARLLAGLNLIEQAREAARIALLEPVWTLGEPFAPIAELAGWSPPIDSSPYRRLASDPSRSAMDHAAHLMDAATVEDAGWASVRSELAALYEGEQQHATARLVRG